MKTCKGSGITAPRIRKSSVMEVIVQIHASAPLLRTGKRVLSIHLIGD
jgi:hypothetical protein